MILTMFSEALIHWPSQPASRAENLPARTDQSVLKSLYYCQCEQYKDDNVNNSHNEQN